MLPSFQGFPIVQWLGYSAFTRKAPVQFRVGKVAIPTASGFGFFLHSRILLLGDD